MRKWPCSSVRQKRDAVAATGVETDPGFLEGFACIAADNIPGNGGGLLVGSWRGCWRLRAAEGKCGRGEEETQDG